MKIWIQDSGPYGMILVVASTEADARARMDREMNYDPNSPVISHDIREFFCYANYGEL